MGREPTLEGMAVDLGGLPPEQLFDLYGIMVKARRCDDREIRLKTQNKTFFQISGAGHEGIQVAVGAHLKPGHDWVYPYYRDRALALSLGQTPLDHFLGAVAAADDPASGGRGLPSHFGDVRLNMPTASSPTGSQFLLATGSAEAGYRIGRFPAMRERIQRFSDDEIVVVSSGDGATSEGEFWESLSTACNLALPLLYLIEDNGYAISVPVDVQTPGGSISPLVAGFPGLRVFECDGTDVAQSYRVAGEAVHWVRESRGPALLHAHVVRLYAHSVSDDDRLYRTQEDKERDRKSDPIVRARRLILDAGVASEMDLVQLEEKVETEIEAAADEALTRPQQSGSLAMVHLYADHGAPTLPRFDTEDAPEHDAESELLTMVDLLNACMRDELDRDPRIVVFGEDVADASNEATLKEVKGKGGVFKVTWGLQRRFGNVRVFNTPLAEASIIGRAVGMAVRGLKPVVEIQFFDYIWPAFNQIRSELATMRWRSNGAFSAPVVIRATYGGYLKGAGPYHSQTGETLFTHTPGLRVVLPSDALDANGLLRTAIRCEDPVLFLEHKHLYRQVFNKGRYPGPDFMIPFGKAKVVRSGTDVTLVTCGALVKKSLDAAKVLAEEGIECEVIDLRSLNPLDMDAMGSSVKKTSRVVIVHEDALSWGIGSEIAARIADELFFWLDAPVRRVASLDTWVSYAPDVEAYTLPQSDQVIEAVRAVVAV